MWYRSYLWLYLAAVILLNPSLAYTTQNVTVAAASDLIDCLPQITSAYHKQNPSTSIKHILGASGNLFAQIKAGAPFDLFLSADFQYARQLIDEGIAADNSFTPYARGVLILWTSYPNLNLTSGIKVLLDPRVRHVAIANPEHAPYGKAAVEALKYFGVYEKIKKKLVMGENIAQAAQLVHSKNADVGILSMSLVNALQRSAAGQYVKVPEYSYAAIEQAGVITMHGKKNSAAWHYLQFLTSDKAEHIFKQCGFN